MTEERWPPEGYVAVGSYAFEPPFISTEQQVEQAEQFIFTQPHFVELEESQRRRNVVRLAMATASCFMLGSAEGSQQHNLVSLIGGNAIVVTERHEGTATFTYRLIGSEA